jgi:hypothetical protein
MKINKSNNTITIEVEDNFNQLLSYLYLMALEFVSDGLFVPSLNPPENNDFSPCEEFFVKEHSLIYKKKIFLKVTDNKICFRFETIDDANAFLNEIERTW